MQNKMLSASQPGGGKCPQCGGRKEVTVNGKAVPCPSCRGSGLAGGGKVPLQTK